MISDLDQKKVEAEIVNLQAQAAKIDAERKNLKKSWRDWILEITKLVGALFLGVGGITAAITGYQLSEVKKERMDFAKDQLQAELDRLNLQKTTALQQLASIHGQVEALQNNLEGARKAKGGSAGLLDEAINSTVNIGSEVATTKAQLRATDQSAPLAHSTSDYLVGLQTLGVDDATRKQLNERIRHAGYSLNEISASYPKSEPAPRWFAPKSTVFYYSNSSLPAAKRLAGVMKELVGEDFIVQRGAGLEVDPTQRDVTLFAHYIKK